MNNMNNPPTILRYDEATALIFSGQRLTGTQKRAAMRAREIHYVSRRRPIDGKLKLERKLRKLPLVKLSQCLKRCTRAIEYIRRKLSAVDLPELTAKFNSLEAYRAFVLTEISARKGGVK